MNDMGILFRFKGILCHEQWKPYFKIGYTHALCNANPLRELKMVWKQDGQQWTKNMKNLLETINSKVNDAGAALDAKESRKYLLKYRVLLKEDKTECPEPTRTENSGKRGRVKRSKSRN